MHLNVRTHTDARARAPASRGTCREPLEFRRSRRVCLFGEQPEKKVTQCKASREEDEGGEGKNEGKQRMAEGEHSGGGGDAETLELSRRTCSGGFIPPFLFSFSSFKCLFNTLIT